MPSSATARREELETTLGAAFLDLLELCIKTVRHTADYLPGAPSYNVLLTLGHMYVFPRRHNAHVLAGFLLVTRQESRLARGGSGRGPRQNPQGCRLRERA